MHLCNLVNNLRLRVGPNGHLSTKPKLAAFFGTNTICLIFQLYYIKVYKALPMHLCNLVNNLRLLLGSNGHLSIKRKLAAFFGTDTICLIFQLYYI